MSGLWHISLTVDQIDEFKRSVLGDAPFVQRVSIVLAITVATLRQRTGEDFEVIQEIEHLESGLPTSSKPAEPFRHPPLHRFSHKHYVTGRHFFRNIGERWNVARGSGNRDLTKAIQEAAKLYGKEPALWQGYLAHHLILGALDERAAARRMTGDWIIFAVHEGQNYYLDLATHEEGQEPGALYEKLRSGSEAEFPFLFESAE